MADPKHLKLLKQGADVWNKWRQDHPVTTPNFEEAQLQGVSLEKAWLSGANLQGANLRGANLERANLQRASLHRADLQCANLHLADLRGASLFEANLHGANLNRANCRDVKLLWANLEQANLQEAILQKANFLGANLQWANLQKAELLGATLEQANLRGTNFQKASLNGSTFSSHLQIRYLEVFLTPEQEQEIKFVEEEKFEQNFDESGWKGREGNGLLLTFSRTNWRPVSLALLCLGIESAVNRLQYLLATEDDEETIQKMLTTPCYHTIERSVRMELREGSLDVFLGFLEEHSKALEIVLASLGLICSAAFGIFKIKKMRAEIKGIELDNRIKEKQLAQLEGLTVPPEHLEAVTAMDNLFQDITITRDELPLPERFTNAKVNEYGHQAVNLLLVNLLKEVREGHNVSFNMVVDGERVEFSGKVSS